MTAAHTWWARRWDQLRQELGIAAESGRATAGAGAARVKRLEVLPGLISAVVQGREAGPSTIEVRVATLRSEQWERVGERLSNLAMVNAQILSGAMPPEIEQVFTEAGAQLLPARDELEVQCSSCPAGQCRHLPQVFALFAEMLNDDPGLLFTLRGRDRQQLLRDVREARSAPQSPAAASGAATAAAGAPATPGASGGDGAQIQPGAAHLFGGGHVHPPAPSAAGAAPKPAGLDAEGLGAQLDQYWGNRKLLKQFHHHIAPPLVELSLLRRLGPINTSDDAMALYEQMVAIYRRITEDALALAYATDEESAAPTAPAPANGAANGAANSTVNGAANGAANGTSHSQGEQ